MITTEERKITIEYKPTKKRVHFIDKMYRINLAFAVFVTLYILGLMTYSSLVNYIDLTPSAYIIAPIWVEVGAFSLANIKKHERENKKDIDGSAPDNMTETRRERGR